MPSGKAVTKKRTASKAERKSQLIEATIRSISRNGLSDTTMANVVAEAGLSQGIVNLHFQSKEKLLLETLAFVVDEYQAVWEQALVKAGPGSAEKLASLIDADFHPAICDRDKLAVWFAFWSESKARPTYRKLCASRDREYDRVMEQLCQDIISEGGYRGIDATYVARGLAALTEGLWLDMLINSRAMSRAHAKRVSMSYLAHIFPGHFSAPEQEQQAS